MKDKFTENPNQITLDDMISQSVENAVSRRQHNLELENNLVEISEQDSKNVKGGAIRDIIVMGYFIK